MNSQEKDQINKKLAGLVGLPWHEISKVNTTLATLYDSWLCSCGLRFHGYDSLVAEDHAKASNPDFVLHPTLVLREMMKREDWGDFKRMVGTYHAEGDSVLINYILDTTDGLLVMKAIEWMEKEKHHA